MQTLVIAKVDGLDVVRGISRSGVDPVATAKRVAADIYGSREFAELGAKQRRFDSLAVTRAPADEELGALAKEIFALKAQLRDLYLEDAKANPVHFGAKADEVAVDDETAESMREALWAVPEGSYVLVDGRVVEDLRGRLAWRKVGARWESKAVEELGAAVPSGHRLEDELDPAERRELDEQVRFDELVALSADEREAEHRRRVGAARDFAVKMRAELEIEGAEDALDRARKFYETQKAELDELFERVARDQ